MRKGILARTRSFRPEGGATYLDNEEDDGVLRIIFGGVGAFEDTSLCSCPSHCVLSLWVRQEEEGLEEERREARGERREGG